LALPEWELGTLTGFVEGLTIKQDAGENAWHCSLTFDVGQAISL